MVGAESLDAFSHSIVQENLNGNLNLKKRAFWNIGFLLSLSGILDFTDVQISKLYLMSIEQ